MILKIKNQNPILLLILDGWGHRESKTYNAIKQAHTFCWDQLWTLYSHSLLEASGLAVGLPEKQMGNSEVGHMIIGAGQVVYQDLTRINMDLKKHGNFKHKKILDDTLKQGKRVHVLGLLSPGGIHAHQDHIFAMLTTIQDYPIENLFVHAILDGRDTPPKSSISSLKKLEKQLVQQRIGQIASICGRYQAMDRDKRFERTKVYYDLLVENKSSYQAPNALDALTMAYQRGETDEFVQATRIISTNDASIKDDDVVIVMNFRADRARQICQALTDPDFDGFTRQHTPDISLLTLTSYAEYLKAIPIYDKIRPKKILSEWIAEQQMTQLRISETEKYSHVTFFFNGGQEQAYHGEDRIIIPSPKVATYDLKPEMSAIEITTQLCQAIENHTYDLIVCNLANADMVGHTGKWQATIKAIETLDKCLHKISQCTLKENYILIITADHGNADCMYDHAIQQPHTAHTHSKVPFILIDNNQRKLKDTGNLADIAPTIIELFGKQPPQEMTGQSLLLKDT